MTETTDSDQGRCRHPSGHNPFRDAFDCEHRPEWKNGKPTGRPYTDTSPGHLVMPDGSLVATLDPALSVAMARVVVLDHWRVAKTTPDRG